MASNHGSGAMTEEKRSPGADVIDILVPVDVKDARPFAARDEPGSAADRAKCAHGRVDASGNVLLRPSEQRLRLCGFHTRFGPRTTLRNRKLMQISCMVVFTFFSSRLFSSR